MPNWKKVIVSGSDAVLGNITASNVSASGALISSELTASGLNYPNTDGTNGQAIITDGNGNLSFGLATPSGKYGIANASGEYTYYSDLSSSLQAATSGDTIQLFTTVTESADHEYHLKDGVNFNFNGNELYYETTNTSFTGLEIFTDNGSNVTCSFYNGKVILDQPSGGKSNLIKITGDTRLNSVGFEWYVEDANGNGFPFWFRGNYAVINGGKFTSSPNISSTGYLISLYYGTIQNAEITVYDMKALSGYGFQVGKYPTVRNNKICGYLNNATNKILIDSSTSNFFRLLDNHIYLEGNYDEGDGSGKGPFSNKVSNKINKAQGNYIHTLYANGLTANDSLGNIIYVETGDYALIAHNSVIGGSIDIDGTLTNNGQAALITVGSGTGCKVMGLSIRGDDFNDPMISPGSNTSIMGCNIYNEYNFTNLVMIEATGSSPIEGIEIANCTFDFYTAAGHDSNYGITSIHNNTVIKFANNTIIGGTLFNPTKVTQGLLNTPDAQGNISMTF